MHKELATATEQEQQWQLGTFEEHRRIVYKFAELGNVLWKTVFGANTTAFELFRSEIREAERKQTQPSIAIWTFLPGGQASGFHFVFPFQLLFDEVDICFTHPAPTDCGFSLTLAPG